MRARAEDQGSYDAPTRSSNAKARPRLQRQSPSPPPQSSCSRDKLPSRAAGERANERISSLRTDEQIEATSSRRVRRASSESLFIADDESGTAGGSGAQAKGTSLPPSSPPSESDESLEDLLAEINAGLAETAKNISPQTSSPPDIVRKPFNANQNASPPTANEASSPIEISSDEESVAPAPAPPSPRRSTRPKNRPTPRPRDFTPWNNDPDATFTNTFDETFKFEDM